MRYMSYVRYMGTLWIAWNHSKNQFNVFKYNIFVFKKFLKNSLTYKNEKSKLQKWKYWEKIKRQYAKEPIFEGKE